MGDDSMNHDDNDDNGLMIMVIIKFISRSVSIIIMDSSVTMILILMIGICITLLKFIAACILDPRNVK